MTDEQKERKRARMRTRYEANREKVLAQKRAYREANPEKVRARERAYREANPEKVRAKQRGGKAGLTPEQIEELKARDGHRCGVCGVVPPPDAWGRDGLQVEHHHASGALRGVVCTRCNYALALVDLAVDGDPRIDALRAFTSRREGPVYPSHHLTQRALREALVAERGDTCEVCGAAPPPRKDGRSGLQLEHHHGSNVVRGLVCQRCNRDVGDLDAIDADPAWGEALVAFATRHETTPRDHVRDKN